MTKCGKCLCSGIKSRVGEVRVKSDKGKRREEKRRSILRLKMMNEGEEDEIDAKKEKKE